MIMVYTQQFYIYIYIHIIMYSIQLCTYSYLYTYIVSVYILLYTCDMYTCTCTHVICDTFVCIYKYRCVIICYYIWHKMKKCSASLSVVSNSLLLHRLQPPRALSPQNSPGKNTRVDNHSFLQGIFPPQGLNMGLLHCRQIFII